MGVLCVLGASYEVLLGFLRGVTGAAVSLWVLGGSHGCSGALLGFLRGVMGAAGELGVLGVVPRVLGGVTGFLMGCYGCWGRGPGGVPWVL